MNNNKKINKEMAAMVSKYDKVNKLFYYTEDETGKIIKKKCKMEAAYTYQIASDCLCLVLIYDGWNDLLQDMCVNGRYVDFLYEKIGVNVNVYTMNINDIDFNESNILSGDNSHIIFDKKGILKKQKQSIKKRTLHK